MAENENSGCECPDPAKMTREQTIAVCEEKARSEERFLAASEKTQRKEKLLEVTRERVQDCIHQGERGAGIIGALLCRLIYRYDFSRKCFLRFNGVHLEIDKTKRAEAEIPETAAEAFLAEARWLAEESHAAAAGGDKDLAKKLEALRRKAYKLVEKLRTERGRQNVLKFAITNGVCDLGISGEQIDRDSHPIPCGNAVIDTRTGEARNNPRIEDFLLRATPVFWNGIFCPYPAWERFCLESQGGDPEMVAFIQRAFGSALIRKRTHDRIFIFSGRGRGGKSTMLEIVSEALGDLASPLPASMFVDDGRGKSAGAATPELELLRGLALGYASEVDQDKRMAQGAAKRLSGGDSQISRGLFGSFEKLKATWTIFLLLNDVPAAPESDFALWERLLIVRFPLSFVDREPEAEFERRADPQLVHKLRDELPGVLAWLVRGAIAFLERGLDPPPKVRDEVEAERAENDFLSEFLSANCNQAGHLGEGSTELYKSFSSWWEETSRPVKYRPSQRAFGRALASKGFKKHRDNKGRFYYSGLSLKVSPT